MSSIFLLASVLTVFLIFALAYTFFNSIIRPIKDLARSSKNHSPNQKRDAKTTARGTEISNIATALDKVILKANTMAESIEFKNFILPESKMQLNHFLLEGFRFSVGNSEQTEFFSYGQGKGKSVFFYHFRLKERYSQIENEIQLAMFKTILDFLFSESENLSPAKCLKEAEEFFRIHLRKNICGDIIAGLFFPEPRMIAIAQCGNPIVFAKRKGKSAEQINQKTDSSSDKRTHSIIDTEVSIKDLTALYLVSPEIVPILNDANKSSNLQNLFSDEPGLEGLKTGIFNLFADSNKANMCFFKLSKSEKLNEI
jgi:hypothetical protein